MRFQIPTDYKNHFKTFFENFDERIDDLGIQSYGISITTLEEVFLKVGDGQSEAAQQKEALKAKI